MTFSTLLRVNMKWQISGPYETASLPLVIQSLQELKQHKEQSQRAWVTTRNAELETMRLNLMQNALAELHLLPARVNALESDHGSVLEKFKTVCCDLVIANFTHTIAHYREKNASQTKPLSEPILSVAEVCQQRKLSAGYFGMLQKLLFELKPELAGPITQYLTVFNLTSSLFTDNLHYRTQSIIQQRQFIEERPQLKRAYSGSRNY